MAPEKGTVITIEGRLDQFVECTGENGEPNASSRDPSGDQAIQHCLIPVPGNKGPLSYAWQTETPDIFDGH